MQAIILCGGLSTRLGEVTRSLPKALLEIGGRPVLDWQLDFLKEAGVSEVILASGHLHDAIYEVVGETRQQMKIRYAREEKKLDTGGAIQNAMRHVTESPFFVLNGDILLHFSLSRMVDCYNAGMDGVLLGVRVDDISAYGEIVCDGQNKITDFREKRPVHESGYINGGVYLFSHSITDYFPNRDVFSIERDVFPFVKDLYVYKAEIDWIDIGVPERLAYARRRFAKLG